MRGAERQRARDQLSGRWGLPAQAALQLTGQPEIPRRKRAYGPEWSVRIHQQKGWQFFDGRPAGHLDRYESVGTDHDTAAFAVNAIRRWWKAMGKKRYPKPKGLLVTADGGGSNGYRVRLWKIELQKLADELKFPITVCHLPPGTSKWNKIEHRLFSFISINWRGK